MQLSVTVADGVGTVVVDGEIDSTTALELGEGLRRALDDGASNLVVDCTAVTFIDSAGLSALLDAHRRAQTKFGSLVVRRPSPIVHRLLEMTSLTDELSVDEPPGDGD